MNKASPNHTRSPIGFSRPSSSRRHLALAVSAALAAGTAQAQQLEEVIVTATKRAESVMDVPLSVSALSGDFLRKINTDDIKDLANFTPGVSGNSKDSFLDTIAVRGITTNDFGNGSQIGRASCRERV